MTWNAAAVTLAARVDACTTRLPALLAAAGLPAIGADELGASGLAVYDSARVSYASPCVEVMPVEGPVQQPGGSTYTTLEGWVSLSYRTTDPTTLAAASAGYLAALVAALSGPQADPSGLMEVIEVSMSPQMRDGESGPFMQGVAAKVSHQIIEDA